MAVAEAAGGRPREGSLADCDKSSSRRCGNPKKHTNPASNKPQSTPSHPRIYPVIHRPSLPPFFTTNHHHHHPLAAPDTPTPPRNLLLAITLPHIALPIVNQVRWKRMPQVQADGGLLSASVTKARWKTSQRVRNPAGRAHLDPHLNIPSLSPALSLLHTSRYHFDRRVRLYRKLSRNRRQRWPCGPLRAERIGQSSLPQFIMYAHNLRWMCIMV